MKLVTQTVLDKTQHLELWVTVHFDARALKVKEVTDKSMPKHFVF